MTAGLTTRPARGGRAWVQRALVGTGLAGAAWAAVHTPVLQRVDVRLGDELRRGGTPALDQAVMATTDLGSIYAVGSIAAVLAATGRLRAAGDVLGVGLTAWNVAQASKTRVRRERPYEAQGVRRLIRPPTGSSFPSGHAAVGAAVMGVLADRTPRPGGRWLLRGLGAYVSLSRVYVGVHYPTDVLGGAGLGLALAAVWRPVVSRARRSAAAWRDTHEMG